MTENNTDVRELVEVEFQLDIPKGPRVRASPPEDGGEAGGEVETSTSYSGSGSTVTPVGEATTDTITRLPIVWRVIKFFIARSLLGSHNDGIAYESVSRQL